MTVIEAIAIGEGMAVLRGGIMVDVVERRQEAMGVIHEQELLNSILEEVEEGETEQRRRRMG